MLAAAESFETSGNYRQSSQILRQVITKYPESKDKAQVLEALARNYLALPNHLDVAIARLSQAARSRRSMLAEPGLGRAKSSRSG